MVLYTVPLSVIVNSCGLNQSILQHSGIRRAAGEAVLNNKNLLYWPVKPAIGILRPCKYFVNILTQPLLLRIFIFSKFIQMYRFLVWKTQNLSKYNILEIWRHYSTVLKDRDDKSSQ
jgi:hypothetical protein